MRLFECGIRYEKTLENGMQKKVTELYIVDALSFTEAEMRISANMKLFISGEFEVVSEKITKYSELVETADGDKWYKAKVNFITLDEKSGVEKKQAFFYLIQAKDIDHARKRLNEYMKGSMADWECEALQETKIMDVFAYKVEEQKDREEDLEKICANPGIQKAAKRFIDSIPDGQKVTISSPGCEDVVIDKTHGHEEDDA